MVITLARGAYDPPPGARPKKPLRALGAAKRWTTTARSKGTERKGGATLCRVQGNSTGTRRESPPARVLRIALWDQEYPRRVPLWGERKAVGGPT